MILCEIGFEARNVNIVYLLTNRWCCAKTTYVPSNHACYNTYQVWPESAKALWRYTLMCFFAQNFVTFVSMFYEISLVYQKAFDKFLPECSEDDLSQFW